MESIQDTPDSINEIQKSILKSPKYVSIIKPEIEVQLVAPKKETLPILAQWIGLVLPLLFSVWGIYLTQIAKNQTLKIDSLSVLIKKYDTVISKIDTTNYKLSETQQNTVKLFKQIIIQNKNFVTANSPVIALKRTGTFQIEKKRGDSENSCIANLEYAVENLSSVVAKDFYLKVHFIQKNKSGGYSEIQIFPQFYPNHGNFSMHNPIIIADKNNWISISCEIINKLYDCYIICEYNYYSEILNEPIFKTEVLKQTYENSKREYLLKDVDLREQASILFWLKNK